MKVLFVIPPFTQLNSPYPSTAKLAGYLKSKNIDVFNLDLSLNVFRAIFSSSGLSDIFNSVNHASLSDEISERMYNLRNNYISVIDDVISFLDGSSPQLFRKVLSAGWLPKGEAFARDTDLFRAFGELGDYDKAKHFCSLFIEDLTNFIKINVNENFGLSRYAERIAVSTANFSYVNDQIKNDNNIISDIIKREIISSVENINPDITAFTIPFPGNLLGALHCSSAIRKNFPDIKIVYGGGYINTELRKLQDPGIFEYTDYITLDDGEIPLDKIINHIRNGNKDQLVRTFMEESGEVIYYDNGNPKQLHYNDTAPPDNTGIEPDKYISLTELLNPMHRMWSDGYWNKLTLAHGCYWAKCTFCDVTLDYIGRYSPAKATVIANWMEKMIAETGKNTFHFTDEAAPPALLRDLSLEILKRKLNVIWWGNIRFEKAFTRDLCKLMALSGCIAVSGGLETADDRLLQKINKGVTLSQVANCCNNFQEAGILVHSYLMYGFPGQTDQETIDSLEYVRQFMKAGLINSGFWHLFTLTEHAPVAKSPEKYGVNIISGRDNPFANNDLQHQDNSGTNHTAYSAGLKKALYNYMNGIGLDWDVTSWFEFDVPSTTVDNTAVESFLANEIPGNINLKTKAVWNAGSPVILKKNSKIVAFEINNNEASAVFRFDITTGNWVLNLTEKIISGETITYGDFLKMKPDNMNEDILFYSADWADIREEFLLFV